MNFEEIKKYVQLSSMNSICVHRDRVSNELDEIIMSVTISSGNNRELFELWIEFDPITMVGEGDGWQWRTTGMELKVLVGILEEYLNQSLSDWDNVTKSGKLENYDGELFDTEDIQGDLFEEKYDSGFKLLPELPDGVSWWLRPYKYERKYGLLNIDSED